MPVGRGFMLYDRILPVVLNVTSSGYFCTQANFLLTASVGITSATGTITFILWTDDTHSQTIGVGTVSAGNASFNMLSGTVLNNTYYLQAVYSGDGGHLPASTPSGTAGTVLNGITADGTLVSNVTLTSHTAIGSGFCRFDTTSFSATVTATHFAPPSDGTVTFVASIIGYPSVTLGTGNVTAGGLVSINVPAAPASGSFTHNGTWSVTGQYAPADPCYYNSSISFPALSITAASGTSMAVITSVPSFCVYDDQTFTVTVTSTTGGVANPTSGTISMQVLGDSGYYPVTTTGGTLSGSNVTTITVTGITDPATQFYQWFDVGSNSLEAIYSGDGACISGSTSAPLTVTTFDNAVGAQLLLGVPTKSGGIVNFCNQSGSSDTWQVNVTGSAGTVQGTFSLFSTNNEITPITSVTTTVAGGSGTVSFGSVPESDFSAGSQQVYVHFVPTVITNCYGGGNSSMTSSFNVTSGDQAVTVDIVASLTNGFSFGSGVFTIETDTETGGNGTVYLLAKVTKGSGIGDDSGTIYFYIYQTTGGGYPAPNGVFFTNTFFTDGGGSSTISAQVTLPAGITLGNSPPLEPSSGYGTYYIQAAYTPFTSCYNAVNSNTLTLNAVETEA